MFSCSSSCAHCLLKFHRALPKGYGFLCSGIFSVNYSKKQTKEKPKKEKNKQNTKIQIEEAMQRTSMEAHILVKIICTSHFVFFWFLIFPCPLHSLFVWICQIREMLHAARWDSLTVT